MINTGWSFIKHWAGRLWNYLTHIIRHVEHEIPAKWLRDTDSPPFFLRTVASYVYSMYRCRRVHKTWDLGIQDPEGNFAKWKRFLPKITLFVANSRTIRKKVPQLLLCKQVMIISYIKFCLQKLVFAFYFHIWASFGISCIHLIDFVAWITLEWGTLGLVKYGSEKG